MLLYSIQSEWLKRKRSLASWLVIIGAIFTPAMITMIRIFRPEKLPEQFSRPDFWIGNFHNGWQSMSMLLLPLGIILAISLITQLEYKNAAWKQLHTTPQSYATIFVTKFIILLVMEVQLFILFNIALVLSALIPAAVLESVHYPTAEFPYMHYLTNSARYFVDFLPVVAIQYMLALQFRNFVAPIGAGIVLMMSGMLLISWEHAYTHPYVYGGADWLNRFPDKNLQLWAVGWFVAVMVVSYWLYLRKADKS